MSEQDIDTMFDDDVDDTSEQDDRKERNAFAALKREKKMLVMRSVMVSDVNRLVRDFNRSHTDRGFDEDEVRVGQAMSLLQTALAVAGFPKDGDREILAEIFKGGLSKLQEAGVVLLGGHTVQDSEIKFKRSSLVVVTGGREMGSRGIIQKSPAGRWESP